MARVTAGLACLTVALGVATIAGCRPTARPQARPLRIALHSPPHSLDPHQQNEVLTFGILRHVYEGLTGFDRDMRVVPLLAESWENPSDLVWRFHLRPNVHFQDGRLLGASDVVASLERARQPGVARNFGSYLVAVADVRAVDETTVEITTRHPYPILLNKLTFVLIVPAGSPETIVEPIGTGPYRVAQYAAGQALALAAFPDYWGKAPAEGNIELLAENSGARRLERLLAGEIDVAEDPTPAEAAAVAERAEIRIVERDSLTVTYLLMNPHRQPFDDPRVRRAVDLALDRRRVLARSELGRGAPLGQMVGRNVFGFDPALAPKEPDPAAARALLAQAGHPGGLDVELELRSGRNGIEVARQLAAAGVRARLVERPWAEMYPRLLGGEVEFYFGAFVYPSADASDFFDAVVHTRRPGGGYGDNNHLDFSDPELDALIERSGSTLDMLKRREVLALAMRRTLESAVYVPLYAPSTLTAVRADLVWEPRLDGLLLGAEMRRVGTAPRATAAPAAGRTVTH